MEISIELDDYEILVERMGENHVIVSCGEPNLADMNRLLAIAAHD